MPPRDLEQHYRRWNQDEIVDRFAEKSAADFFDSEVRLLKPIAQGIDSVIDVGCASGRFIELLARLGVRPAFVGIDLSEASIARAQSIYPDQEFHRTNALAFSPRAQADLVNATGVVQHEPQFEALLDRMIDWSRRYVMFDAKLAGIEDHLADRTRAFVDTDPPLYFVVLSLKRLLDHLRNRQDLARAQVFAYPTPLNARVRLPADFAEVFSAGILLEKGTSPDGPELILDVPAGLSA